MYRDYRKNGREPPRPPAAEPYADEYRNIERKERGIAAGVAGEKCEYQRCCKRGDRQTVSSNEGRCGPGARIRTILVRNGRFHSCLRQNGGPVGCAAPSGKGKKGARAGPARCNLRSR